MTTLDDKLLGLKTQNYVSSSESEGEDEYEKSSGEDDIRDDKIDLGDVVAPPDFRLEVPKVSIRLTELSLKRLIFSFMIVIKPKLTKLCSCSPIHFSSVALFLAPGFGGIKS